MALRYLLDTNISSDLVRRPGGTVATRIVDVGEDSICTSIVVAAELRYGATKSNSKQLSERVGLLLSALGRSCASMRPRHLCILHIVALPLQTKPREADHSVFVDDDLSVYPDQWAFLATIKPMSPQDIEPAILHAAGPMHPLDVTFIDEDDLATPWKRPPPNKGSLSEPLPQALTISLANLIYFEKAQLTQPLSNRLIRFATFQNPEFYRAKAMRLSVWDKTAGLPFCTAKPSAGLGPGMAGVTKHGVLSAELRSRQSPGPQGQAERSGGPVRDRTGQSRRCLGRVCQ